MLFNPPFSPFIRGTRKNSCQFSVVSLQFIAYSLQLSAYSLQLIAYSLQLSAYSLQLSAYSLQLSAYSLQPLKHCGGISGAVDPPVSPLKKGDKIKLQQ